MSPTGDKSFFYEEFADRFDQVMCMYDVNRRLEVIYDEFLNGESLAGKRLLDAGCGTGWFTKAAVERGASVVSLDMGPRLLAKVNEKAISDKTVGSVLALPFKLSSFDIIVCSEVIEHTPHPCQAIPELARVLRPKGRLLLTVPNRRWKFALYVANALRLREYDGHENWVGWKDLGRWLKENNLQVVDMRGIHILPWFTRVLSPFLRWVDHRFGHVFGPWMVNICVKAYRLETVAPKQV